ncbi:5959_t:CDS:2, partial [Racocetra persica]
MFHNLNERSNRTNVSNNDHIKSDSNNNILSKEDFNYIISNYDSYDNILDENDNDILNEDGTLSEDGILNDDDLLRDDNLLRDDLLSDDNLLNNESLLKDDLLSEDDWLNEDDLLSANSMMSEDDLLRKEDCKREIVDKSLSNEDILSINREFAPYFIDIIYYLQFKSEDVVKNIRRFKKYRQKLPLLKIKSYQVHISNKKTPSTSRDTKK